MAQESKDELQSVTVRLPVRLVDRMDAWGRRQGLHKRSDFLRLLLTKALDAEDAPAHLRRIEEVMTRMHVHSEAEAVSALIEDFLMPEEPTPPDGQAKPKKRGGMLRSLF